MDAQSRKNITATVRTVAGQSIFMGCFQFSAARTASVARDILHQLFADDLPLLG